MYSGRTSFDPPVYLPDGSEFRTWETPLEFSHTYFVNNKHPKASDDNPGTEDMPFLTINRAAQVLKPGERVLISPGIYRECVRPARGGDGPGKMISYEAAGPPWPRVIITGSEKLDTDWRLSTGWRRPRNAPPDVRVWMASLSRNLFDGYNPFAMINQPEMATMGTFRVSDEQLSTYMLSRGLVFQEEFSKPLKQVPKYTDLYEEDGTYWVEPHGLVIHLRPIDDLDPREHGFEITTREQTFAPEQYYLGYIRVKGFTMQRAGDGFPIPQRAALSTMRGHHWIIEDNVIRYVNALGMDIGRQDWRSSEPDLCGYHIVRRNRVEDCGICGICGVGRIYDTLVEDNMVLRCCWHNVEPMWETAGIKLHLTNGLLIRRNIIMDTKNGSGIWLDYLNVNTRCCQNVIVGTETLRGGIFVEASHEPNMVDHNFVWDTKGDGIHQHDGDKLMVAHNMIGKSTRAAVYMALGSTTRWVSGRGATSRKHRVLNNILVDNARMIEFANPDNFSDYNLFCRSRDPGPLRIHRPEENLDLKSWQEFHQWDIHGAEAHIDAEFDPEKMELAWSVRGEVPACPKVDTIKEDFWGQPRAAESVPPGPFANVPSEQERIKVDPRSQQSNE